MFKPHAFKTLVFGLPTVLIDPSTLADMWTVTDLVSTEVGWMSVAKFSEDRSTISLSGVYVPKQQVHAATSELTPEGMTELGLKLMEEDRAANVPTPDWRANNLRCWMHSHANMDVSPSGQDNTQATEFREKYDYPWLLRGIVNKKRKIKLDLFMFEVGLTIEDVDWAVSVNDFDVRETRWRTELAESVKAFGPTSTLGAVSNIYPFSSLKAASEYKQLVENINGLG